MNNAAHAVSAALILSFAHTNPGSAAAVVAGTYFEDTAPEANCQNSINCLILFPPLPQLSAAYFLTVTHISCIVYGTKVLNYGYLEITDGGSNPRRLSPFNINTPPGYSTFREEVVLKVAGGPPRQLRAVVRNSGEYGAYNLTCKLVGVISSN